MAPRIKRVTRRLDGVFRQTRATVLSEYAYHPVRFFSILFALVIGLGVLAYFAPIRAQIDKAVNSDDTSQIKIAETASTESRFISVAEVASRSSQPNEYFKGNYEVVSTEDAIKVEKPNIEPSNTEVKVVKEVGAEDRTKDVSVSGTNDTLTIESKDQGLTAGAYKVETVQKDTGKVINDQKVLWGVLAFNPDYAVYPVGKDAFFSFAVLDDRGKMVCTAAMTVEVTDPTNKVTILTTADGTVRVNKDCEVYGKTDKPDYEANFKPTVEGDYKVKIVAKAGEGTRTLHDQFSVKADQDFYLQRVGVTRTYPPVDYDYTLNFEAKKAGSYVLDEFVPSNFEIKDTKAEVTKTADSPTKLSWNIDAKAGQTYPLTYTFKTPNISPFLFELGPAEVKPAASSQLPEAASWLEPRSWLIASDNACQSVATGNWSDSSKWTSCGGTVPQAADTVQILNTHNITEDTASVTVTDITIDNGGTLTVSTTNAITVSGNWSNSGTFTAATGTVTFSATDTGNTIQGTLSGATGKFYNLVFNGAAGEWTPNAAVEVANDLTMTAGSLLGTQNVTVNGHVAGTAGIINLTGGTFTQSVGAAKNFGTTSGSTAWTFYNLTFTASSVYTITTQTGGTGDITVTNILSISSSVTTFDGGNRTYHLTGSGTSFAKSGHFTAGTSTVSYENTTSATITGGCTGTDNFYNIQTSPASGTPTYTIKNTGTSFLAGTLVMTPSGSKPIESLKDGDIVLSYDIAKKSIVASPVTGTVSGSVTDYYIINDKVKTTSNHIFIMSDYSQKSVEELKVGDSLATFTGNDTIRSIRRVNKSVQVFDIEVQTYHLFFANSYLVHNLCSSAFNVNNNFTMTGAGSATIDAETLDPNIVVTGNFTIGANQTFQASSTGSYTVAGNYSNSGTFTAGAGTINFTATDTGNTIQGTLSGSTGKFYKVVFAGAAGEWTPNAAVEITNDLTMTAGTLLGTQNITVNGNVACVTTCGTINLTGGTFEQRVAAAKNFGTSVTGTTAWTFYDLTFSNSHASSPFTITTSTAATGGITVSDILRVGKSGDAAGATTTLNTGNRTWTLSGTTGDPFQLLASPAGALAGGTSKMYYTGNNAGGNTTIQSTSGSYYDLEVNAGETFVLEADTVVTNNLTITHASAVLDVTATPYALTIGNNYSNSGTFTARTGTVTFNATDSGNTLGGTMTGTSAFYNLIFNGVAGAWSFAANPALVSNDFTITNGTVTAPSTTLTIVGKFDNSGTFTHNSGTVKLTNATTTSKNLKSNASSFNNLEIDNGLVGYWKFDEGTGSASVDQSVNGNTATLYSSPPWTSSVKNSSYYGSDPNAITNTGTSYASSAFSSSLLNTGGPVTVSFWNYVATADVQASSVFGVGAQSGGDRFQAHTPWSDSNLYWDYGDIGGTGRISTSYAAYLDKWTYVTLVSTGVGGNYKAIYLDGALVNSAASSDGPDSNVSTLEFMRQQWGYEKGKLDDFRIYNRVISANEVTDLYNGRHPGSGTSSTEGTYTLIDALTVAGNLNVRTGMLDVSATNFAVGVAGNYLNVANFNSRAGTFTLNGTATGKTLWSDPTFYNLTTNGSGGGWTQSNRIATTNNFDITNGTYDLNTTYNFALSVTGNFTGNSGTWTFNERASTITVSGNWDTSAIAADNASLSIGTSTVVMNGTGTKTLKTGATSGWNPRFYNLNVGQAAGKTTQILTNATSVKNVTTVGAGTFDLNSQAIYIGYSGSSANPLVLDASATVGTGNGYLEFIGAANAIVPAHTYNTNIYARNSTYATTQGGDIIINGSLLVGCCETPTWTTSNYALTVDSVTFAGTTPTFNAGSSAITIRANWTTTATTIFNAGTSTFTFSSTSTGRTITSNGDAFYNVVFNGVGGGWTFQDAMAATNDFTVTNGAVTANNLALTVTRDFTLANTTGVAYTAGSSTVTVSRHFTDSGNKYTQGTSSVVMNGTGTIAVPWAKSFYNLSVAYSGYTTSIDNGAICILNVATLNGGTLTRVTSGRMYLCSTATIQPVVFASPTTITNIEWFFVPSVSNITVTIPGGNYGTGNWFIVSNEKTSAGPQTTVFDVSGDITMTHNLYFGARSNNLATINTNNYALTANSITYGTCISWSCTSSATVNFGSSTVTLNTTSVAINPTTNGGSHYLNLGSSSFNIKGNYTMVNGTGTITVNPGTSTVNLVRTSSGATITNNGQSFYNVVVNGVGGGWTFQDATIATNDFTVTNGAVTANNFALTVTRDFTLANTTGVNYTAGSSTITVSRHWNDTGNKFTVGTSTVVLNGTGDINVGGNRIFYNLSVAYAGFTTTHLASIIIQGTQTLNGGTYAFGNYSSGMQRGTSGTSLVFASPTTITSSSCCTGFTFWNNAAGITQTVPAGDYGQAGINLQISRGGGTGNVIQLGGNVTTTGSFNAHSYNSSGTTTGSFNTQNYSLVAGDMSIGHSSFTDAITLNLGSSTITSNADFSVVNTAGGQTHQINMGSSNISVKANVRFINGSGTATVDPGTSTLTWTHTSGTKTYSPNGQSLYNVTLNGSGGTVTPDAAVIVTNDLTMTAGTLSGTQNVTVNGAVAGTAGIISLTGGTFEQRVGAAKNFGTTSGSTAWTFYDLTFSNSHGSSPFTITTQTGGSGGITVSDILKVGKSGDAAGATTTLNAGNRIWTLSGTAGDPFQILASPLGALVGGTSKFYYTGANGSGNTTIQSMTSSYYDLELNSADTFVLEGDTVVTNNLTITHASAILDVTAAPYALTIGGNYSNSGTFTARTGTVTLNGSATQTLSGTMTTTSAFYNLTITNSSGTSPSDNERTGWVAGIDFNAAATVTNNYVITTANARIEYNSGSTYTIANINWNGGAIGTRIYFRNSAITGTWLLNVSGTQTAVSYVNVSRSDASSGSAIVASDGTNFNAQNNTNWTFSGTVTGTVYGTDESTAVVSGPTVRMYINGTTTETATANGSGVFTFTTGANANDVISIYLDTAGGITGLTVTKATGSALSNVHIYQDRLTTRCDNTCSLTNANIDNWDKGNDTDIHATVTTNNLTVDNDWKLKVANNTFAPGGTITTSPAGGSSYQGQVGIDASAVLDMAGNALSIGGNYSNSGTFTAGSNTTTFTDTATGNTLSGTLSGFYNIVFDGVAGAWTFNNLVTATNDVTVTNGAISGNGASGLTVTRDFTLANTAGVSYSPNSSTVTVSRHWNDTGAKFVYGTSTVVMNGTGTLTGGTLTFYNLMIGYSGFTTTLAGNAISTYGVVTLQGGTVDSGGSYLVLRCSANCTPLVFTSPTSLTGSRELNYTAYTSGITITQAAGNYGTWNLVIGGGSSLTGLIFSMAGNYSSTAGYYTRLGASSTATLNTNNYSITAYQFTVNDSQAGHTGNWTVNFGSATHTFSTTGVGFGAGGSALGGGSHTYNLESSTINIAGSLKYLAGSISIAVNPGTSIVNMTAVGTGKTITSNGQSFYNLVFNGVGGGWTFQDATIATNDFTVTNGAVTANNLALTVTRDFTLANTAGVGYTAGSSTITVSRHWADTGAKFIYDTSTVNLTGTGNLNNGTNANFYKLSIGYSGFTTTFTGGASTVFNVRNILYFNGGTVDNTNGVIRPYMSASLTPIVFNSPTTLTGGNLIYVSVWSTGVTTTLPAGDYGNWKIYLSNRFNGATTYQLGGNVTTTGNFVVGGQYGSTTTTFNTQNYSLTSAIFEVGLCSDLTCNAIVASSFGSSTVTLTGTSDALFPYTTAITHTLNMGSSSVGVAGNVKFVNSSGAITVTPGTSTLTWTHTSGTKTYSPNGQSLYNVVLNGSGGTVTPDAAVAITNDLTMTAGTLSGTQNVTVNGAVAGTAGIISLTGGTFEQRVGAAKNFGTTSGSTAWTFYDLTFSNSHASSPFTVTTQTGGTGGITVSDILKVGKSGDAAGATTTLNAGNRIWTLSGTAGDPFQLLASPAGALVGGTSKFYYTGANAGGNTTIQSMTSSYYDLELNAADTFVLEGDTVVTNNLTITHASAILDVTASNYALTIGNNYSNSGTFTARSGTVTFNATDSGNTLSGTLNGTSAFFKVIFNGVSGAWTIQNPMLVDTSSGTPAADTLVVSNGTVTVGNGDADNLLVYGGIDIATTANQTAVLQTMDGLAEGSTITLQVNKDTSTQCANCIVDVGASSGSGQGTLTINENGILKLIPKSSATASDTGVEVASTGKLNVTGALSLAETTSTAITDYDNRETKICANATFTGSQFNGNHVRITSGLAVGQIYAITATTVNDAQCDTGTHDSITRADTSTASVVSASKTLSNNNGIMAVCIPDSITADNQKIGSYMRDFTGTKGYFQITDSANDDASCTGTNDLLKVIESPDVFSGFTSGDTVDISDGVRPGDNFEIYDYANVTAEDGVACTATANEAGESYIRAIAGSETVMNYADVCNLGRNATSKYGVQFDSVNGTNASEGVTIDRSRLRSNYYGSYLNGATNNNTGNSKGVTNSSSTSNLSYGFQLLNSANSNTFTSNVVSSNAASGFFLNSTANSNSFTSNVTTANTGYGFYFNASSANNTLTSNTSSGNTSYGYYLLSTSTNNTLTSNAANGNASGGFLLQNGANNNALTSNTATGNSGYGFNVNNVTNNAFTSNIVTGNGTYGFTLTTSANNNTLTSNTTTGNGTYGFLIYDGSNNNTLIGNQSGGQSYGLGFGGTISTGNKVINDVYGTAPNTSSDILFSTGAHTLSLYNTTLSSTTEVTGVTVAGSYIISRKYDTSAGTTYIWGEYAIPSDTAETPQDEDTDKFNYANNLWEKSVTAHGYSGTGTEDTNLSYDLSAPADLSGGPYSYRLVTKTAGVGASCVTSQAVMDVYRNGTDVGDLTTGTLFTDSTGGVNTKFTVDCGATPYALNATYTFTAYDADNSTSTVKPMTMVQDGDIFTVGSGKTLEMKGQTTATNLTTVTRGPGVVGRGFTKGYRFDVAGTIDAQYYKFSYLGSAGGATGLDLQSGATLTNLDDGQFDNYQNVGATDTYITVHGSLIGTGSPAKTWDNMTFLEASDNVPEYSVTQTATGAPAAGNYWVLYPSTCTGWASCEASDSDTGDGGSDNLGFLHWQVNTAPNDPSDLAQKKTDDTVLAVGDWTNETSVKFTATADDTDNPDTLYLCVEKKLIADAFTNTEDSCGSGVAYSGTPVTVIVTIAGITDANEYHWQARVKDTIGDYSGWISYGANPEANRDFGVDTTACTYGSSIYDGTVEDVDASYNDGSLTSVSANWDAFTCTVSGLNKYQYSIGTTAGATDIKTWTDNSTTESVTSGSLILRTNQNYFFNVRAVDNATNTSGVTSSNGQSVLPTISLSLGATTITFANLNNGNNRSDSKTLTLTSSTNAYGGYVIRQYASSLLTRGAKTIPMFEGGTYASPGAWPGGTCTPSTNCGYGYTSDDTTIQGVNIFGTGTLYAPLSLTAFGDIIADHTTAVDGTSGPVTNEAFTITHKVSVSELQEANPYTAEVLYILTGTF